MRKEFLLVVLVCLIGGAFAHPCLAELTPLAGDVDGDGFCGAEDLRRILLNWGRTESSKTSGEITGDGIVGVDDYLQVLNNWGQMAGPQWTATPAPQAEAIQAIVVPLPGLQWTATPAPQAEAIQAMAVLLPAGVFLPGDANGDGLVGEEDLRRVNLNWGRMDDYRSSGELTGDGYISIDDYMEVMNNWGKYLVVIPDPVIEPDPVITQPTPITIPKIRWTAVRIDGVRMAGVPEPATLGLMLLSGLAILRRRR